MQELCAASQTGGITRGRYKAAPPQKKQAEGTRVGLLRTDGPRHTPDVRELAPVFLSVDQTEEDLDDQESKFCILH